VTRKNLGEITFPGLVMEFLNHCLYKIGNEWKKGWTQDEKWRFASQTPVIKIPLLPSGGNKPDCWLSQVLFLILKSRIILMC
jgi:hypothetical protein